ncbi:MAG: hypothetical protein SGILL_003150 [Bacillariaceae sp.]
MTALSHELEVALGPDTAELAFRIGLHSGPVTGGVLRGQNSRFQLFGDTMNMASRMESTGARNCIHISTETAQLLKVAGKGSWIEMRDELTDVKGKGSQHTYWVKMKTTPDSATSDSSDSVRDGQEPRDKRATSSVKKSLATKASAVQNSLISDKKIARLVDWNVAVLSQRLQAIQREHHLDDDLDPKVMDQLKSHVEGIAHMYRKNPFHNFEHASHVTMSCVKMLSRVTPSNANPQHKVTEETGSETTLLKDYTNDIKDCPLTQFAVVYAALVHDVDHAGVSNDQLVKEGARIASMYNNKSVAENHSYNLAFGFLMQPDFEDLVTCICGTDNRDSELERFSKVLQNAVLATDVFDKDLKAERDARWANVFGNSEAQEDAEVLNYLRAQIVLEHMIQASDVIHTMQHWHIYQKWNERLFVEMYQAYMDGRLGKNPSGFWYQGEIGFFDFYVIPLAKKLGDCGVFGVSSDEFLKYAQANRQEWEIKGKDIVSKLVEKHCDLETVQAVKPVHTKAKRRMSGGFGRVK